MKPTQLNRSAPGIVICLLAGLVIQGCATHCGLMTYCDIPEGWPVTDTFTVETDTADLCISGKRHTSCASKGVFQTGVRTVDVHMLEDHADETELSEALASLRVTGSPGDHFTVSCFQYNGSRKILGMTEVLTGFEIRDDTGTVVDADPSHPVPRRNSPLFGC